MKKQLFVTLLFFASTMVCFIFSSKVNAASFRFLAPTPLLGGDGPFQGAFEGTDSNTNGLLEINELDFFTASFKFSPIPTISWSLNDLENLQMPAEGGFFLSQGRNTSDSTFWTYIDIENVENIIVMTAAPGGGFFSISASYGPNCQEFCSGEFQVTRVPEPTSLAASTLGLVTIIARKWRWKSKLNKS